MRIAAVCLLTTLAAPAMAQTVPPEYLDDRSTPARVIQSLYNAIDRAEYLRGWSYYNVDSAPDWPGFADGYADTDRVALRIGEVVSEGAAGSVHSLVPVAVQATATDGTVTVFTGCYRLTQVQPAAQIQPPFLPIRINDGSLDESDQPFDTAMGQCESP